VLRLMAGHMWYVVAAIWIAVVAAIVWASGRKSARRESERERRFRDMLGEAKLIAAATASSATASSTTTSTAIASTPTASTTGAGVAPPVSAEPTTGAAPVPAQTLVRKPRLLAQADALLYYVLRTGLPDHEVFASLTLADLVELPAGQRGYDGIQKQRRLAQQRIDFVLCNRRLEIVAAIVIDRAGPTDAALIEGRRLIEESLQAAGIRLICIDASAPPRHQQVRALVYGDTIKTV
jgi:hypothetical protein